MPVYKNEKNGTWYSMVRYRDWTGENKQKCQRGFATRREALEWEAQFKLKKASDIDMTLESFYEMYEQDAMSNQNSNPKCKGSGELTLLDFLERAEGKNNNLAEKKFVLAGGGMLSCSILTTGGYGAEIQYQGAKVLTNTGRGWGYEMTPAELAKKDEFYSIYWNEYNSVKGKESAELYEVQDYLEPDRPSFEAKA